jgi:glycosyltransferase involved in cell wall biosynthesis
MNSAGAAAPGISGRVAVIHDWLTGMRGGESVLEGILEAVPQAELYTLFHFPGSVSAAIESRTVHTTFLQKVAPRVRDYRELLPLFPAAARSIDVSGFDVVISSSHCVAKGIRTGGRPHLSYCHTPMRYVWDRFDDYFPPSKPFLRLAAQPLAAWLRRWDRQSSATVTRFAANSTFVRDRIHRFYDRDADVIHPFVEDVFLAPPLRTGRGSHHVVVSALVPYKKVELAIAAATESERELIVIGGGPLLDRLSERVPPNVRLLGRVHRDTIVETLATARSLILPGVEDFGITPLEAMALGTPVVALGEGGVVDSVIPGSTGIFFSEPTVSALVRALDEVEQRSWDRESIRAHAAQFSRARFRREFIAALDRTIAG